MPISIFNMVFGNNPFNKKSLVTDEMFSARLGRTKKAIEFTTQICIMHLNVQENQIYPSRPQ